MKTLLKINFAALLTVVLSLAILAQTNAQIERELVAAVKEVQKYSNYGENYNGEKLSKANENFAAELLAQTKNAATLKYKFGELAGSIYIATSADGKFRVYSWDTEDGGTMHNFSRVYQYQGADGKVYSKTDEAAEEGDAGAFVYDIFTQPTKSGAVYAVCSNAVLSNPDNYQNIALYKIEGGALKDKIKLFKTKEGTTNSIGFEYDFFSVADRPERPLKLFSFDAKTGTIKFPIIIADKEFQLGKVTNRFISYRFDGTYFIKIK